MGNIKNYLLTTLYNAVGTIKHWDASAADFASVDEYQAFLNRALEWSLYDTGVSVTTDDHILTLITCDRDYNSEDGQLVVMAVQQ